MAINQSFLRSKAKEYHHNTFESLQESVEYKNRKKVFLCHSHKDEDLVEGLIRYFEEQGLELYVDWKDHSMPTTTNKITADKIKKKIEDAVIFMFLATADAKASRWCPWEIGFADATKKEIVILPTTDGSNNYGNEYLDLYNHIDIQNGKLSIRKDGKWENIGK